jgi:hypothetical protein
MWHWCQNRQLLLRSGNLNSFPRQPVYVSALKNQHATIRKYWGIYTIGGKTAQRGNNVSFYSPWKIWRISSINSKGKCNLFCNTKDTIIRNDNDWEKGDGT